MNRRLRRLTSMPLTWPLVTLGLHPLLQLSLHPGFFHLELKDGHLFGSLVDIVKNAAPVMIIATGMTLVIATGGIRHLCGCSGRHRRAIAGILVARYHAPLLPVLLLPLIAAALCGAFNGLRLSFYLEYRLRVTTA